MLFYILLTIVVILYLIYLFLIWNNNYWSKRNVPHVKPHIGFGNVKRGILMQQTFHHLNDELYKQFRNYKYCGYYNFREPSLFLIDLELIKAVFIKDFNAFHDNTSECNEKNDKYMSKNPFFLRGDQWKLVRSQLSPTFSSGKMKHMFPQMVNVSERLVKYISQEIDNDNDVAILSKELCSRYTVDAVASCVLSLDVKSFENSDSEFRRMGRKIITPDSYWASFKIFILFFAPKIADLLGFGFITDEVGGFFQRVVQEQVDYRKQNKIVRNDFLDFLLDLQGKCKEYDFDIIHMTSHVISFFTDGFETSSITMSYVLYDLASNPDYQHKLRQEIDDALIAHNGQLSYDALNSIKFLDNCITESLRLHPPVGFLRRTCTKSYTFPPADEKCPQLIIEPGTPIIIPLHSIARDPEYFPNPNAYEPERFSDERKHEIAKCTFLAFGEGPRQCIGMRFATMQIKVGVVALLRNFELRINKRTQLPLKDDPSQFLLNPIGGIWLTFHKIKK